MASDARLKRLAARLRRFPARPGTRIMEVCGTHTVAIRRFGIQKLLPETVRLVSGPGCPVCVTPDVFIDEATALAHQGVIVTSFGDMLRVPGSRSSLEKERAAGSDIRAVYSPLDALAVAEGTGRETVFLAVGFETTAPAIAAVALKAFEKKIANFYLLTSLRLVPPALKALLSTDIGLSGFLLPGHVSAIIGRPAYEFLSGHGLPGVIAGFDAEDIVSSLLLLLEMHDKGIAKIVNNYPSVVRDEGNEKSRAVMADVFAPVDAEWRGLGMIPRSGLELRPELASLDARQRFALRVEGVAPRRGCRCGDVLRGLIDPPGCPLFNKSCRPDSPVGPCMVSAEGSCSAWVLYA